MSETITVGGHEMNVDEYIRYEIDKFERLVVGRKLEPEEVAIETDMAASMFAQRVADHNTASAEEHEEGEKIKFVVKEDDKEPETIELINCLLYTSPSPRD